MRIIFSALALCIAMIVGPAHAQSYPNKPIRLVVPFVKSGQVRALAVTTPKRSTLLPAVPTMAESGVPNYDATSWYGILGPTGLPREILTRLGSELAKIVRSADLKERFATLGIEPVTGAPEEFANYIRAQVAKWSDVAKSAGVELE